MTWKNVSIPEFSHRYEVSDRGQVRNKETGQTLKPYQNKRTGYLQVMLTTPTKRQNANIHRLILSAFKPNTNSKLEVNHINEDKLDNRLSNLEWVTSKQNINWGQHTKHQKETLIFGNSEKTSIPVIITRQDGAQVMVSSIRQASLWTKVPRNKVKKVMNTNSCINGYCFSQGRKHAGLEEIK